jgi:hypothetical protein
MISDSITFVSKLNSVILVREQTMPTERLPLVAKLVPPSADTGSHVVSTTDSYSRVLESQDRSRYYFFQVAPQLYSRG